MNAAEIFVQGMPELPTQVVAQKKFRFNPYLVIREETDDNGRPLRVAWVTDRAAMYYIDEGQWVLFQYFDGERTFAEIAEAYARDTGFSMTAEEVREFALSAVDTGLWYESAQERNITLSQKLKAERQNRLKRKGKFADLSHILFQGWDADNFLTRADQRLSFIYTRWFTNLTLCLFAVMIWIWVSNWTQIGHDTIQYYTFTEKSAYDIAEFWLLVLFLAFFHECAHGLTAKHYGAHVHNIGFQLIYLTPAFACDITELWARAGRRERLLAIIAGLWVEMIFCGIASIVWWSTTAGTSVHEWAYKMMMMTGIIVLVVNLNPLMKLDGYYALAEIVGVPELKEQSTAYLSGWLRKNIYRLPVEYDYIPPRKRRLFIPYAVLSGIYCYFLLFAVSRFAYNVFHRFYPEWAFLIAGLLAWKIFKSRILHFVGFMKTVYLHHRLRLGFAHNPRAWALVTIAFVVLFFVPMFRKTQTALFILEPIQKATLRAQVPGFVEHVFADEDSRVSAGSPIASLKNVSVDSDAALAQSDVRLAEDMRVKAHLQYAALGPAQSELERARAVDTASQTQLRALQIVSPISGIVITPRPRDAEGTFVGAGAVLAEVADTTSMKARLYLAENEMKDVRVGAPVALKLNAATSPVYGDIATLTTADSEMPEGLLAQTKYRGLKPPPFYVAEVIVPNNGRLKTEMTGNAKVFVRRESLAAKVWDSLRDAAQRKIW